MIKIAAIVYYLVVAFNCAQDEATDTVVIINII
jgi:hypothetical protein